MGLTTHSRILQLPTELQLHIASHLPYPDALALKHTNSHFYALVPTTVKLKVAWLVSRHERHLPNPCHKCLLKTDEAFCKGTNGEVQAIIERRRKHGECKASDGGCEVIIGATCKGPQSRPMDRVKQVWNRCLAWIARQVETYALWALVALIFSICFNVWLVLRTGTALYGLITPGEGSVIRLPNGAGLWW